MGVVVVGIVIALVVYKKTSKPQEIPGSGQQFPYVFAPSTAFRITGVPSLIGIEIVKLIGAGELHYSSEEFFHNSYNITSIQ